VGLASGAHESAGACWDNRASGLGVDGLNSVSFFLFSFFPDSYFQFPISTKFNFEFPQTKEMLQHRIDIYLLYLLLLFTK
jgi:hypothetical protein